MKNWLTPVAVAAFALTTLASCEKDEDKVMATPSANVTLASSSSSAVLLQANETQNAFTFTWNPIRLALSDGSASPAVKYELQIAKKADGFGFPGQLDAGTGSSKTFTVKEFNEALVAIGSPANVATPAYVRIAAVVGDDKHTYVSNVVPLTVTGYTVCLPPAGASAWSIIGPAGVDWNTDVPLTYNCTTNTFDITRNLNAGEFKFRANKDWAVNYGSSSSTGGALVAGGGNITVATAGVYTIKFDLNKMVYSIAK